jgi:hypothetical protein
MLRRIAIVCLLLSVAGCGVGAWLAIRGVTGSFIAPGAANVRVVEIGPGQREITYSMPNPDDGWQTAIARRLSLSGWRLDADRWQWGGTETTTVLAAYVRTSHFWFFTIYERAELWGDRSSALIRVSYSLMTQRQP